MFNKLNIKIDKGYLNFDVNGMENFNTTYIFAKNGTGKTTYTELIESNKNIFIFNSNYVAKNIYINKLVNDEKESTAGSVQTSNSYTALFGDEIKKHVLEEEKIYNKQLLNLNELAESSVSWNFEKSKYISFNKIDTSKLMVEMDYELLNGEIIKKEITDKQQELENLSHVNKIKEEINSLCQSLNILETLKEELNNIISGSISEESTIVNVYEAASKVGKTFSFFDSEVKQKDVELKTKKGKK